MMLTEAIKREHKLTESFMDKSRRAKSLRIKAERKMEADYHRRVMGWLMELEEIKKPVNEGRTA